MSRRRDLENHRRSLAQVGDILNSMKTLAYMETRKLDRFLSSQSAVVRSIEQVAGDFLDFYPFTLLDLVGTTQIVLLIGSERGFCGSFNHALYRHLEHALEPYPASESKLIVVGHKLHRLFDGDERVSALVDGAGVVEEIGVVLGQLTEKITALQADHGSVNVRCLYHRGENDIAMQALLPPFRDIQAPSPPFSHPPVLNLGPAEFLEQLTDQYLFAALHEMLYTSLMLENRHRVAHLEGAVRTLEEKSKELTRQCNVLRQEEIVEEIEVILLNVPPLGGTLETPS